MNVDGDKNGVNGNNTDDDMLNENVNNNNEPMILDSKQIPSSIKVVKSPVITIQPSRTGDTLERPRRRQRRSSDVIDSIGMDIPRSPADKRSSGEVFITSTSPSDKGYSSSPSSQYSPFKPVIRYPRVADTIDAAAMTEVPQSPDSSPIHDEPIGIPTAEALMPVERDSEEYNMNHPRRGRAVVFNNDDFEMPGMNRRDGSDQDVKNLQRLYSTLGFEIQIHHNKKYQEIVKIIDGLAQEDHSDADCLVVTVLSHGLGTGFLLAKDCPYTVDCLWNPFTGDKCPTLAGKPKLFFIQACRGEGLDPGVSLVRRGSRTETDSGPSSYKIPIHADFLLAFSSVQGYFSFRNPDSGTWFIQCLCQEFLENSHRHDLLKLLTRTARRVAVDYESYNDVIPWQHQQKQVPTITSMLIRDVYFRPKN